MLFPLVLARTLLQCPGSSDQILKLDASNNNVCNQAGKVMDEVLGLDNVEVQGPFPRFISRRFMYQVPQQMNPSVNALFNAFGHFVMLDMFHLDSNTEKVPSDSCGDESCLDPENTVYAKPKQPLRNKVSSFLDLSQVYGQTPKRLLQRGQIQGPLFQGIVRDVSWGPDIRTMENSGVQAIHALFAMEHNRRANLIANTGKNDDDSFQLARMQMITLYQKIVYQEYLPTLGLKLAPYQGYNSQMEPAIEKMFIASFQSFIHSTTPTVYFSIAKNGANTLRSPELISHSFFHGMQLQDNLDDVIRGLIAQPQPMVSASYSPELGRSRIEKMQDIAASDIQLGRDLKIHSYADIRPMLKMSKISFFSSFPDKEPRTQLPLIYGTQSTQNLDLIIGGLSEQREGVVGSLFQALFTAQFQRLREGDRFHWAISPFLKDVQDMSFAQLISMNTKVVFSTDVFKPIPLPRCPFVFNNCNPQVYCSSDPLNC